MFFIFFLPQSSWKAVVLMNPALHKARKASKHLLEMNNRSSRLKFVLYFAESVTMVTSTNKADRYKVIQ